MTGAVAALSTRGRVIQPLVATATPAYLETTDATSTITTGSTTASVSGGVGPFTYAWEWVSNPNSIVIDSSTSASTTFTKYGATSGGSYYGVATCKVRDTGNGNTIAYSNDVGVGLDRS